MPESPETSTTASTTSPAVPPDRSRTVATLLRSGWCQIQIAGQGQTENVWLMPHGTLYWPAQSTLFVADVHLGKAASYRQQGQPVPTGTTSTTLSRLSMALSASQAKRLIVLGDFLHSAAVHRAQGTLNALRQWRARHPELSIILIRGNHDDHVGDPESSLGIEVVNEPYTVGPFACRHAPEMTLPQDPQPKGSLQDASSQTTFWLAGHLHPVLVLKGQTGERIRLKGFVVRPDGCILPAFGAFTGGHPYEPARHDRCFVVIDEADSSGQGQYCEQADIPGARVLEVPAAMVQTRSGPTRRDVRALHNAWPIPDR